MEINFGDPTMRPSTTLHDIVFEAREQDVGKPCKRGFCGSHCNALALCLGPDEWSTH
jgi:hypothetical protein